MFNYFSFSAMNENERCPACGGRLISLVDGGAICGKCGIEFKPIKVKGEL